MCDLQPIVASEGDFNRDCLEQSYLDESSKTETLGALDTGMKTYRHRRALQPVAHPLRISEGLPPKERNRPQPGGTPEHTELSPS